MSEQVRITGAGQAPYTRRPGAGTTTAGLLLEAARRAVADAGLDWAEVDGLGVSSFTLAPDHAIDFAWKSGLKGLRWMMDDPNGGASGVNLLDHAVQAVRTGQARTVVLVSGDLMDLTRLRPIVERYNAVTESHLTPLPMIGPNPLFAMLTQRQMGALGLSREDYGRIVIRQREWAGLNPGAVYREPMSMEQYLGAPIVADPLGRFDCVPPVSGADAVVVTSQPARRGAAAGVRVRAVEATFNHDAQVGDGARTGLVEAGPRAWEAAGIGPEDADVFSLYDDYPAIVVAQLIDLGVFSVEQDVPGQIAQRLSPGSGSAAAGALAVNTSGGQLSAGQAGAAGSMHGLVEVFRQLTGAAGQRQVEAARIGVVSGYGMVLYRYGACANIAVLEGEGS